MPSRKPPTRHSRTPRAVRSTHSSPTEKRASPQIVHDAPRLPPELHARYVEAFNKLIQTRRELKAKYDAAQTYTANENHWENADHFDPHSAASLSIRRTLRARSRYEVIENNPYLKGTLLTIANDFTGSNIRLQITDKRLSPERRTVIEEKFQEWAAIAKIRQKLWRMRMAKLVDGETFAIPYTNRNRRDKYPVSLDFYIIEADRISSQSYAFPLPNQKLGEIDGVRFNAYEEAVQYHLLQRHPGGYALDIFNPTADLNAGKWIDAQMMIHWFRRDRGWLRGIPELAPSLALCALLRRYTLAIIRQQEILADFTILLETDNPASPNPIDKDAFGNLVDDPFDIWPIEFGMMSNLPYGYKAKQMQSVPLGTQYDTFVGALLREITRPILAPYNIAAGTSKDSNMASGVLDQHIYKGGQQAERTNCEEEVVCNIIYFWWNEAVRTPGYLGDNLLSSDRTFSTSPPKYRTRWDRIGIDHTDPQKVAQALQIEHDKGFITDGDVQEEYHNRSVEDWQAEMLEQKKFRDKLGPVSETGQIAKDKANQPVAPGPNGRPKPKVKAPANARRRKRLAKYSLAGT